MPVSSRQIPTLAEKESGRNFLRDSRESDSEGTCAVGENLEMTMDYDRSTDVMFLDLRNAPADAQIDVLDVGESIGFPGQVQVRVDSERGIVYGITIQRFSAFKRKIMWQYRMASIQRALQLLVNTLLAGVCINHNSRQAHLHA
jgi:hypothetical protein